jgi:hypothetical protein
MVAALIIWITLSTFSWENAALRTVIDDIQHATEWRFLYRDAIVADIRITLATSESAVLSDLQQVLAGHGIGVQADAGTRQVVLYPARIRPNPNSDRPLQGVVLDDATGGRLPYATILWADGGHVRGVMTDESGRFRIPVPPPSEPFQIQIRHVGYRPLTLLLEAESWAHDLAVRLETEPLTGPAVIVQRGRIEGITDSTWALIRHDGGSSGFSEPSALRTLQALPSVAMNGAIQSGLIVRGSKPDGFQVLLDGVPVYNHQHLFGLFDPFNPDALQAVGVHTGITPALYPGPPGGTLSYLTKSASLRETAGTFGASSSAIRGSLGIPVWADRASILLAGRVSYLNQVDWFGNRSLIQWGLNVDRPTSEPALRTVFPTDARAAFHDLHAKITLEGADGSRWLVTAYTGGDDTRTDAERYVRPILTESDRARFESDPVATVNSWGSTAFQIGRQARIGDLDFLHASLAFASYDAAFEKEDFLYVRYNAVLNRWLPTLNRFAQENRLREWRLNLQWDRIPTAAWLLRTGILASWSDLDYQEQSLQRPDFGLRTTQVQVDVFAQADGRPASWVELSAGVRLHALTLGGHTGLSPRVQAILMPDAPVRIAGGWSVNHQYLHSVSVKQQSSADVWIGGTSDQPPSRSDQWTIGVDADLMPGLRARADAYVKSARDVRLHEVNPSLLLTRESPLEAPWFARNRLSSSGLETMVSGWHPQLDWMASYTWSRSEVDNPDLNNGDPFPADWDRRHQGSVRITYKPLDGFSLTGAFSASSGAPNTSTAFTADEPARLAHTRRFDAGIQYVARISGTEIGVRLSVYNVTDRDNVWYRTPVSTISNSTRPPQIVFRNLDVYDLGRHVSVDMRVGW